jgi:hypothetical protein
MPFDSHGDAVIPGMLYAVGRDSRKVLSETMYDIDADILLVRRKGSQDPWNRIDEIDSSLIWVPVDADGVEIQAGDDQATEADGFEMGEVPCL